MNMEKKQTAVDWLLNEIDMQYPEINVRRKEWMVDKAKEMERMQIKDAYSAGVWEIGCFNRNPDAKKYYEENYQEL
jgi:hypothetical protein